METLSLDDVATHKKNLNPNQKLSAETAQM